MSNLYIWVNENKLQSKHNLPRYKAFFRQEMAATFFCCPKKHIPALHRGTEIVIGAQADVYLVTGSAYLCCSTAVAR